MARWREIVFFLFCFFSTSCFLGTSHFFWHPASGKQWETNQPGVQFRAAWSLVASTHLRPYQNHDWNGKDLLGQCHENPPQKAIAKDRTTWLVLVVGDVCRWLDWWWNHYLVADRCVLEAPLMAAMPGPRSHDSPQRLIRHHLPAQAAWTSLCLSRSTDDWPEERWMQWTDAKDDVGSKIGTTRQQEQ